MASEKSLSKKTENKLHEIAAELKKLHVEGPGLMNGKTGQALFLMHYAYRFRKQEYYDAGLRIMEEVLSVVHSGFSHFSFCNGLAGIFWAINLLRSLDYIDADPISRKHIDLLTDEMMKEIEKGNYDCLHGALGVAIMLTDCLPDEQIESRLLDFIEELARQAMQDNHGIWWMSELPGNSKTACVDLGMAHGQAAIIRLLTVFMKAGLNYTVSRELLEGALHFMWHQQLDPNNFSSVFPNFLIDGIDPSTSRMAWCYGDPGIGYALINAAEALQNKTLLNKAKVLFRQTAFRRNLFDNLVKDASLCHGSAGLALIFKKLHQKFPNDIFKETSIYWLNKTLDQASFKNGLAGYCFYRGESKPRWSREAGLLEGVAGIGMALLENSSNTNTHWEKCLLL